MGVFSGAVAHALAGGALPGPIGFLPALVFSTLLALFFLKKKTLLGVSASVVAGQWVFHYTLSLLATTPVVHHHGPVPLPAAIDAGSIVMGAGHGLAAALTAGAVMAAEAIWSLIGKLGRLVVRWVWQTVSPTPVVMSSGPQRVVFVSFPHWGQRHTVSGGGLRGPPVLSFTPAR